MSRACVVEHRAVARPRHLGCGCREPNRSCWSSCRPGESGVPVKPMNMAFGRMVVIAYSCGTRQPAYEVTLSSTSTNNSPFAWIVGPGFLQVPQRTHSVVPASLRPDMDEEQISSDRDVWLGDPDYAVPRAVVSSSTTPARRLFRLLSPAPLRSVADEHPRVRNVLPDPTS